MTDRYLEIFREVARQGLAEDTQGLSKEAAIMKTAMRQELDGRSVLEKLAAAFGDEEADEVTDNEQRIRDFILGKTE